MVQLQMVDKTAVLILAPTRPWVRREGGRERASQGKGKRNVAGRGWIESYTEEWRDTRGKYCCRVALTTSLQTVVKT